MTAFFSGAEELSGSVADPALLPSSSSRNARLRVDEELTCIMTKTVNELGLHSSTCVLSHPSSPPSHMILEIRIRRGGISIQGPAFWSVPGSPHFYTMPGCGSLPSATDGNLHTQLPRRLVHSGPVVGGFNITQDPPPQPLRLSRAQGQLCQEHTVTQPMSFVPGDSYRLNADDSYCLSGANYDNSAPCGFLQGRYRPSAQSFPDNLCSLKATHVPGKMNQGADMLSRNNVSSEEWTLHPLAVQKIWEVFCRARADLFASKDNSHCPIFFTKSTDALAHEWPSLPLYAFSPVALLPQVLRRVREQHKLILIAPLWRNQPWVWVIPAAKSSLVADPLETGPSLSSKRQWYGIHGLSYGPCMCCRSTGDFRPPRACPENYGRS